MESTYDEAVKEVKRSITGFEFTEVLEGKIFTLESNYFTLYFDTTLEEIQLGTRSYADIIDECLLEEFAEMRCMRDCLMPYMVQIVADRIPR